jgi:hypothetical protein
MQETGFDDYVLRSTAVVNANGLDVNLFEQSLLLRRAFLAKLQRREATNS